jgi:TRAP-type C4-dicarboxylate transport system permease small subunit
LTRLLSRLTAIVEWWSALLLGAMVTVVLLGVFFRYVVGSALVWYDEFASYLLVWLTFYGAVVACHRRQHVRLDFFRDKLGRLPLRVLDLLSECCVFGFQLVLLWCGTELTGTLGDETSVSLGWVKMAWVYSVLPISGGMMLFISFAEIARLLANVREVSGARVDALDPVKEAEVRWSGSSLE